MNKLKIKDQIHISKRLGFLISADIPILKSLRMLEINSQSKRQKKVLKSISVDVNLGLTLSKSLEKSKAFNQFGIYLAEVGETSGNLGQSLSYLAEELENKQRLKQKIIGALIYPLFISVAATGMSLMLITFVFPKILPILSGLNGKLPIATQILIFLSSTLRHFGFYILGAALSGGATFFFLMKKFPKSKFAVEQFLLRLPYINSFFIYYQISNFARTISLLLKSDLVLDKGLLLIARHTSNLVYQKSYRNLRQEIVKGGCLAFSMQKWPLIFPALFKEMVEVGEETGKLSETFAYLSNLYEAELTEKTKNLSGMIEPILMIFMGVIIGGVALSIILPIYQITANLHH